MPFSALPNELILDIGDYLDDRSISHLMATNRRYGSLLEGQLYKRAIVDRPASDVGWPSTMPAISWAVRHRKPHLLRYLFAHGITGIEDYSNSSAVKADIFKYLPFRGLVERYRGTHWRTLMMYFVPQYDWPLFSIATKTGYSSSDIILLFVEKAGELGRMTAREATQILEFALQKFQASGTGDPDPNRFELIDTLISKYHANATHRTTLGARSRGEGGLPFLNQTQDPQVVKLLLQKGADPFYLSPGHEPALYHHAWHNQDDDPTLVRLLLEAGVHPNLVPMHRNDSETALQAALTGRNPKIATTLLEFGATICNFQGDNFRATTLYKAISIGIARPRPDSLKSLDAQIECVRRLLEGGASANSQEHSCFGFGNLQTYLDVAVVSARDIRHGCSILRLLLEYGADPHVKDQSGKDLPARIEQVRASESCHVKWAAILAQVALDMELPTLLPGNYILTIMKSIIRTLLEKDAEHDHIRYIGDDLFTASGTFDLVLNTYKNMSPQTIAIGEMRQKLQDFWDYNLQYFWDTYGSEILRSGNQIMYK
ncbi:ankyrin [Lophium mytilinum]|uniref:Ankyrin n=1 Tax=Lophium mytilinum TaxID=390894 RepID=A0A6A6QBB8_9PEZI|nr:ankyrin [Lophium mytilinum]